MRDNFIMDECIHTAFLTLEIDHLLCKHKDLDLDMTMDLNDNKNSKYNNNNVNDLIMKWLRTALHYVANT